MNDGARPTAVMFVCFGNICRSPMAEFVFKEMARRAGAPIAVASAATACEEGRPVHPAVTEKLREEGVPAYPRKSVLLRPSDAEKYDLFVGMDEYNTRAMRRILGEAAAGKICRLLDFTDEPRDIADPWYTGDFDATYRDVSAGCKALLGRLVHNQGQV